MRRIIPIFVVASVTIASCRPRRAPEEHEPPARSSREHAAKKRQIAHKEAGRCTVGDHGMSPARGDRVLVVVEKPTELGVAELVDQLHADHPTTEYQLFDLDAGPMHAKWSCSELGDMLREGTWSHEHGLGIVQTYYVDERFEWRWEPIPDGWKSRAL